MRLVGGELASEGTIQLCRDEVWGTVCDDFWDSVDADIVCRQLGFGGDGKAAKVVRLTIAVIAGQTLQKQFNEP